MDLFIMLFATAFSSKAMRAQTRMIPPSSLQFSHGDLFLFSLLIRFKMNKNNKNNPIGYKINGTKETMIF